MSDDADDEYVITTYDEYEMNGKDMCLNFLFPPHTHLLIHFTLLVII